MLQSLIDANTRLYADKAELSERYVGIWVLKHHCLLRRVNKTPIIQTRKQGSENEGLAVASR